MERKIGEIFEFKKDWYQCVEGRCKDCHFSEKRFLCKQFITKDFCTSGIILKKLEKVGNPYIYNTNGNKGMVKMQEYKLHDTNFCKECDSLMLISSYNPKRISIEIKQNKEDMEEYKMHDAKEDIPEFDKVVDECLFGKQELKLKPFDLQKAKAGKSVCTRDGRSVRIICFDKKCLDEQILIALVDCGKEESIYFYTTDGKCIDDFSSFDLMMLPEKKEGWVNVYCDCDGANITKDDNIYSSKDAAIASAKIIDRDNYVATTIIKWEE